MPSPSGCSTRLGAGSRGSTSVRYDSSHEGPRCRCLVSSRITINSVHTAASAGLLPPHGCQQPLWELHLAALQYDWPDKGDREALLRQALDQCDKLHYLITEAYFDYPT